MYIFKKKKIKLHPTMVSHPKGATKSMMTNRYIDHYENRRKFSL